jgi:hypothetical protein
MSQIAGAAIVVKADRPTVPDVIETLVNRLSSFLTELASIVQLRDVVQHLGQTVFGEFVDKLMYAFTNTHIYSHHKRKTQKGATLRSLPLESKLI